MSVNAAKDFDGGERRSDAACLLSGQGKVDGLLDGRSGCAQCPCVQHESALIEILQGAVHRVGVFVGWGARRQNCGTVLCGLIVVL